MTFHRRADRFFEPLEQRQMLSASLVDNVLVISTNNDGADVVSVAISADGQLINVIENGALTQYPFTSVANIRILTAGGKDAIDLNNQTISEHELPPALIDAGDGNDSINGGPSADTIYGGAGNDTIEGGLGNDFIDGGEGRDSVEDLGGNDTINGGPGNDDIFAGSGSDELFGGPDNDYIDGGLGSDRVHGGAGIDTADYHLRTENLRLSPDNRPTSGAAGENDTIDIDIEALTAGSGNDVLIGSDRNESLSGEGGNDLLRGNGGDDFLVGGFDGSDTVDGGTGRDTIFAQPYGTDSGDNDVLDYSDRTDDLNINLNGQPVSGAKGEKDTIYRGFEVIRGGSGNDTIIGTDLDERIFGNAGNDRIDGGTGADVFSGGAGSDTLNYSNRRENLILRVDGLAHSGAPKEKDTIQLDFEVIRGGFGNDLIVGSANAESTFGGAGNDEIRGYGGNDRLDGGEGNDKLIGGDGNDMLIGRAGLDSLYGQNGNDLLYADDGIIDLLVGGSGRDRFRADPVDGLVSLEGTF